MTFFRSGEREQRHSDNVGAYYSTETVETRADGWTAQISRTERSESGEVEKSSALVDVGSISALIAAVHQLQKSKAELARNTERALNSRTPFQDAV